MQPGKFKINYQNSIRNHHLDFLKGTLVLVMVIYHSMNYFTRASPVYYEYLRFVTGAFIFMSGYMVANYYRNKYQVNKISTVTRLLIRGLKLLILFTILNIILNLIQITNYNNIQFSLDQFITNSSAIYFLGNDKLAAFQILVPISYLLLASPIFLVSRPLERFFIPLFLLGLLLFVPRIYWKSYNLHLLFVGITGIYIGIVISFDKIKIFKNKYFLIPIYLITIFLMRILNLNIITYSSGIFIILIVTYSFSTTLKKRGKIIYWIEILGQYSLFSYIIQIVFLQILFRFIIKQRWEIGWELLLINLITGIFLISICSILKFGQKRYNYIDYCYKFVFA